MNSAARNVAAENARAAEEFRKRLEGLAFDMDETRKRIVNQAVNIGLAHTTANTPVGTYSREVSFVVKSGKHAGKVVTFTTGYAKTGGTLRRNWKKSKTYKEGNAVVGGYANATSYAVYVNNGHRVVSKGVTVGFWPGYHMLEIGQRMTQRALPLIYRDELARIRRKSGF